MKQTGKRYHIAWAIDSILELPDDEIVKAVQPNGSGALTAQETREALRELKAGGAKAIPQSDCNESDEAGYCKGFVTA